MILGMENLRDSSKVTIRKALEVDVESIRNLIAGVVEEKLIPRMNPPERESLRRIVLGQHISLVAESGVIVGAVFILRGSLEMTCHLGELRIYVARDKRKMGIGSLLLKYALQEATSQLLRKVVLNVLANNLQALQLYERFGFTIEGVRRQQYKFGDAFIDEVLMAKFI
jgi:ribosomal protein S18 acetylase RimI-like enzyme